MTTAWEIIESNITKHWISPVFGECFYNEKGKEYHRECLRILNNPNPTTNELLTLVYRLVMSGIPKDIVVDIIDKQNTWIIMPDGNKYSKNITDGYISNIVQYGNKGGSSFDTHNSRPLIPHDSHFAPDKLIDIFLDHLEPFGMPDISQVPGIAAREYISVKIPALPRNSKPNKNVCKEKCFESGFCKHPNTQIHWKKYKDEIPTLSELSRWNFSPGVCLIANRDIGFLDVDIKSPEHPNGVDNFDISRFKGYYYEKTKNGGYHIFGKGEYKPKPVISSINHEVKIIGYGGLIVSYPTTGYNKKQLMG